MSNFLILTNNREIKIDNHLFLVEFSDTWRLYYDKGHYFENHYLYTGLNSYFSLSEPLKAKLLDGFSPQDLFDIFDDYCIILSVTKGHLLIVTDRFGKIPIFYTYSSDCVIVTTDLKENLLGNFTLLDPSSYISINTITNEFELRKKPLIDTYSPQTDENGFIPLLSKASETAVLGSIKNYHKIGLLYSGGIDSSIIALILKKNRIPFTAIVVGSLDSHDVRAAQEASKILDIDLHTVLLDESHIESYLKEIDRIIQTVLFSRTTHTVPRVVSLEVALVLYLGIMEASNDKCDVILSAIGTEELFIGFSLESRHLNQHKIVSEIMLDKLGTIYTRDMYRNYRLSSHFNIDMRTPFISTILFELGLAIPIELKVHKGIKKYIWRITGLSMGLPEEIAFRKNKATQFGSSSSKLLSRLAKRRGYKYKSDYISDIIQ